MSDQHHDPAPAVLEYRATNRPPSINRRPGPGVFAAAAGCGIGAGAGALAADFFRYPTWRPGVEELLFRGFSYAIIFAVPALWLGMYCLHLKFRLAGKRLHASPRWLTFLTTLPCGAAAGALIEMGRAGVTMVRDFATPVALGCIALSACCGGFLFVRKSE